jgi:hypothetical protein
MKPEIKAMWLDALRSGEYQQGQGVLRSENNEYCCLGVLCDLYQKQTGDMHWNSHAEKVADREVDGELAHFYSYDFGNEKIGYYAFAMPPQEVFNWSGLYGDSTLKGEDGKEYSLPEMNDGGKTFEEIAQLIELYA